MESQQSLAYVPRCCRLRPAENGGQPEAGVGGGRGEGAAAVVQATVAVPVGRGVTGGGRRGRIPVLKEAVVGGAEAGGEGGVTVGPEPACEVTAEVASAGRGAV